MKYRQLYIIIIIFLLRSADAFSQDCITNPTSPPVLTSVSVQPENGNTKFTWTPSSSPGIVAYILYSYKNGDGIPIDTIWDPGSTSTLFKSAPFSESYVVAAMREPRCTSILSNVLNSIFEKVTIDTCLKKIVVTWNSYQSIPSVPSVPGVTSYSVLLSVDGNNLTEAGNVKAGETSFTLNDFNINAEYCFIVRANLEGGSYSTSNKTCLSTKMQRTPQWINADQATLNSDGNVALTFTIDPLSEIKQFSLERKAGLNGVFQQISQPVSINGKAYYIDNKADTNIINNYRLSAINSCNLPVMVSNIASNMVLSMERSGDNIVLSWNPYKNWLGSVSSYRLFVNTGKGFKEIATAPSTDTTFVLAYQQIMYDISEDDVCFYINATERSNPHGIFGESISSKICSSPTEIITVPNVFTPNNDLNNDLFRPVLSFTPTEYNLIISNRQGRVLFETRDFHASWDGTQNGNPQPQGVYLWFLKLTTPSGKAISKTGTITIIRSR